MKKDIITQTRFKTVVECEKFIEQLYALDDAVITSTYEDILAGKVEKKILRTLIDMVSCKMKHHSDFQSIGDIYVAAALYGIGNKVDAEAAFMLHNDASNTNPKITLTIENIQTGKVDKEILLKLIYDVGVKIQNHPDFKSSPCKYISHALVEIGSGKTPSASLKLKKGSRHKNHIIDEQRIAYEAWRKIKLNGEKTIAVFSELATDDKSPALIKKYYERYHNKITKMLMLIQSEQPSD